MKRVLLLAVVVGCGGKHSGGTTVVKNTAPPDAAAETYGGDDYGDDEYGDDEYGGDEYGGDQAQEAPTPPDVTGLWASACVANGADFRTIAFDNTATSWDLHVATFGDAKCARRTSDLHFAGAYTIGAASTTVPEAWEGTFSYATLDLTADDAKTAKALGKLCGVKKLKAGKPADLAKSGCVALGVHPLAACPADNDIVAIEGNKLRLGVRPADNDTCTADKRPTALDTSIDLTWHWKPFGVAACDQISDIYEKFSSCSKIPQAAIDAVVQSVKQTHDAFGNAMANGGDASQIGSTCDSVRAGLQQALTASGC